MKFKWAHARYEAVVPAGKFGAWLTALPDQNPATIVDAAADKRSPAHKLFQWDDSVAATEHRLSQARTILGSFIIETTVTSHKGSKVISAPYVSRAGPGSYEITTQAMKVSNKRDFMLSQALAEVNRWRRRYAALSELAVVFAALDEISNQQQRRKRG